MNLAKLFWVILGLSFLGLAYIGVLVPGMPTTIFVILAAWSFAKSSVRLNTWLHEHPRFGPYLIGWEDKRIFPYQGRYAMMTMMTLSLGILIFTTTRIWIPIMVGGIFVAIIVWAYQYPGSEQEYQQRQSESNKIENS